jgi:hypothetical protein
VLIDSAEFFDLAPATMAFSQVGLNGLSFRR